MSHDEGDIAMANGWIAFDRQDHLDRVDNNASSGMDTNGAQELAFLGSVGILMENFAKNLDDFIGHALDEWSSPRHHKTRSNNSTKVGEEEQADTPDTRCDADKTVKECASIAWSWNESFSDDDDRGWIGTRVMSPGQEGTSTGGMQSSATKGRPVFDMLHEQKESIRHTMKNNPLDRYKKQNAWLKSKVLGLEKQIVAMEQEETQRTRQDLSCSLHDEHVTLQLQIEQLLSQKSRLVYENDSLKRENARLNELIAYFFASSRHMSGAEEEEGDGSDIANIDVCRVQEQ